MYKFRFIDMKIGLKTELNLYTGKNKSDKLEKSIDFFYLSEASIPIKNQMMWPQSCFGIIKNLLFRSQVSLSSK